MSAHTLPSVEREIGALCYRAETAAIREVLTAVLALEALRDAGCDESARWEEALSRFQTTWAHAQAIAPTSSALDALCDRGDRALGAQTVPTGFQWRLRGFALDSLLFAQERELQIEWLRLETCRVSLISLLGTLTPASRASGTAPLLLAARTLLTRVRELQDCHAANQGVIEAARRAQERIEEYISLPGLSTPPTAARALGNSSVGSYVDDVFL